MRDELLKPPQSLISYLDHYHSDLDATNTDLMGEEQKPGPSM